MISAESRRRQDGIAEGFERQRLLIVPSVRQRVAARLPVLRDVRVTHLGQFWEAARHFVDRPKGTAGYIWIYCSAGRGGIEVGGRNFAVGAGDLVIIPPRKAHRYFADAELPWTIFWFHVAGERAGDYPKALGLSGRHPVLHAPATDVLQRGFEEAYYHALDGFTDAGMLAVTTAFMRLVGLFRVSARSRDRRVRQTEERVAGVVDELQQALFRPWTVREMAEHAGMSVPHFSKCFKRQTGAPPTTYLIHLRMQRAAGLLQWSGLTVAEIGERVGYEDPYYFSRSFRSVYGFPPRDYRARVGEE